MIKRVLIVLIAFLLCGVVSAQQPTTKPAKPDAIGDALKAQADASAAFDAAKARLEAAQANTNAVLFREMAEQGVKPSECARTDSSGNVNPFACISRDTNTGAWAFKKDVAAKAAPQKPSAP